MAPAARCRYEIRAGLIDVEIVMAVLDGVDRQAAAHEFGDQPLDQGRLAGVLPAGDAEDALLPLMARCGRRWRRR